MCEYCCLRHFDYIYLSGNVSLFEFNLPYSLNIRTYRPAHYLHCIAVVSPKNMLSLHILALLFTIEEKNTAHHNSMERQFYSLHIIEFGSCFCVTRTQ